MNPPTFKEERALWKKGYRSVVGVDEVGRGPLAGPVVACAVALRKSLSLRDISRRETISNFKFLKLRDSKKLTQRQRERFYKIFINHPGITWGLGSVYPVVIDRINIYQATRLAMKKAVTKLLKKCGRADFLIIDGNMNIAVPIPQKAIIRADELVVSCAMASIIAKVTRDRIMIRYHLQYPKYGFDRHKGYGTPGHIKNLKRHGRCAIHRKTFTSHFVALDAPLALQKDI